MDRLKPKGKAQELKEDIKAGAEIVKGLTKFQGDDGSILNVKPGIKKKGKVLKLEFQYDKSFIDDDVHITLKAGCGEIVLTSPKDSDAFSASFCATKSF